jgi:hypothetical protein
MVNLDERHQPEQHRLSDPRHIVVAADYVADAHSQGPCQKLPKLEFGHVLAGGRIDLYQTDGFTFDRGQQRPRPVPSRIAVSPRSPVSE